jgi:hypothetical protein
MAPMVLTLIHIKGGMWLQTLEILAYASESAAKLFRMTPKQIELIQNSDALWPVRRQVADLFYSRFFELAPDARALFPAGYWPTAT